MTAFSTQHLSEPLRILLIEDDEGDRDLALEYLKADRSSLYQVTWAGSLEAGLNKLENAQFDAIILDLVLPDSRGVTTVSKLCSRSGNIPVIVSSYFDENALASKVIELGAQDYLAKDLMDSQTLSRTMSRALARAKHQASQLSARRVQRLADSATHSDPLSAKIQQLQADIRRLESVANDINQVSGELQALNDSRQRMVTTLSHECRSPATVILLATNILKSYDKKIDDAQYLTTITRIDEAVKQIMQLLDSAMSFKRAQSLTNFSKPERFNLQALCQETILKLTESFTPAPYFRAKYVGDCTNVLLYKEVARHILVQLLTNAVQYSPAQTGPSAGARSPIEITIQNMVQNSTQQVTIHIKDRGCGISAAEQDRIFEAFYRASHVDNNHGIGLGLTIVKTCVNLCGGQISLKSKVDKGTHVTVTLPEPSPQP